MSYVDGIRDVSDFIVDSFEDIGFDVDDELIVPVGVSLAGGYQFGFGGEIMAQLGPPAIAIVEVNRPGSSGDPVT